RDIRGYWLNVRASSYVASKRLPWRTHVHVGTKRYEVLSKLESESQYDLLYPLTMFAVDQSYFWGMLMYERDVDPNHQIVSEALMYRGLPSWDPQFSIGLMRYLEAEGRDTTMMFFALYFYMDNFLMGLNF
ncbi:MAG: hypothetical protein AAB649_04655, partial [Patescibacteria group bacterium]